MKKIIYYSAAVFLLLVPSFANAQVSESLSPTEVFCSNLSSKSGNALKEISKMKKSNRLSFAEKQVLVDMSTNLSRSETIENICFPSEL